MRYNRELGSTMSFLFTSALCLASCSSDASQAVQPGSPVAVASVAIDSTILLVGHSTRATAKDSAGALVSGEGMSWKSLDTTVATVSSSGDVMAVGAGNTAIQGTLAGTSGQDFLTVVDLASHNFDDGTIGPSYVYPYTQAPNDLDFPADPTNSGRGNVARLHYRKTGTSADVNRSFAFGYPRRLGQHLYFKGDFYIPVADLSANGIQRKLLYTLPYTNYTKYGSSSSGNTGFASIVGCFGNRLHYDIKRLYAPNGTVADRHYGDIGPALAGNRWYTLEVQQTMETTVTAADGIFRVWLDGVLVYEKTNMKWIDPAWSGTPLPGGNGTPYDLTDAYFTAYLVGDQVNYSGAFDEYRYWDNARFSTRPIRK